MDKPPQSSTRRFGKQQPDEPYQTMRNANNHSHTFDSKVVFFLLTWGTSGNDYVYR